MSRRNLKKTYEEDQSDRKKKSLIKNLKLLKKRDLERRKRVEEFLKNKSLKDGEDYYYAAMVFHHGPGVRHSKKAVSLAKKSVNCGYEKARWLYAAAVDRLLVKQNKKQKFGTQFAQDLQTGKWSLFPVDPETSDAERKKFNVPKLSDIKRELKRLNKHKK